MFVQLFYLAIAFLATFFGSLVGWGGGVIIKPALDLFSHFNPLTISVLSSGTVFAMTVVTIIANLRNGITIDRGLWPIVIGAGGGGYIGKILLLNFISGLFDSVLIKGVQALILGTLMILMFLLHINKIKIAKPKMVVNVFVGIGLGATASFLGIGGGPLNVIALVLLCGYEKKYAIFGSIFIIFAAQGTKLIFLALQGQISLLLPSAILPLIIGAITGSFMGGLLFRRLSSEVVSTVFNLAFLILAAANICVACWLL